MKKGYLILILIICMVAISVANVSASEIVNNTYEMQLSDAYKENIDLSIDEDNALSDEYYDESTIYTAAFYENKSVVNLLSDEINWNVKNLTEIDEYGSYDIYLSTFMLDGIEYTIEKEFPTSGVYGYPILEKFNPNEYDIYDGIYYKLSDGRVIDIIDISNYRILDNEYFKTVGICGYHRHVTCYLINNTCYKFDGGLNLVSGFFNEATEGVDYRIIGGNYYTIDDEPIENLDDNYKYEDNNFYSAVIDGFYCMSSDGIIYDIGSRWNSGHYYIKINETFYRIFKGKMEDDTGNSSSIYRYVLINGQLCPLEGKTVLPPINLDGDSDYTIIAPDVTKFYNGPERFVITLLKNNVSPVANANVRIFLNGVSYDRTTDNAGQASIALGLHSGKFNVTTSYKDKKAYSTVTVKDTIISNDFSKIFRNATQYQGKFVDSQGNLLRNVNVEFNINGVMYTRTTDNNGIASMNINLNPGTYVLTALNPSTGQSRGTTITVLSSIVENYDLTKYYKNASQYSVRILDGQGKPVGEGVSVVFNINGVFYTRTSNGDGYVNMNINLNPGTYIITAEYNGLSASSTIRVLSILSGKDISMIYRDGTKFEEKLLDGQGNPFPNQLIKFNVNGVFYERITDENGIASLNINLPSGEYIITAEYNGLSMSNIIKIAPDLLYYTIGGNPLNYDFYMSDNYKFSFDWYYSPQWDSNVKTIFDIYDNVGMEIQNVKYGIKYVAYEASTDKEIALNSDGEVISWTINRDYMETFIVYDQYNNVIARGHWINGEGLPY